MKILLFFLSLFLPLSEIPVFTDHKVIESTCERTPYYKLCVSALKSDLRSADADVLKLGIISVDIIAAKSNRALSLIEELLESNQDSETREVLMECRERYNAVIIGDIPQAMAGLQLGNYKFAVMSTGDAALEARVCELGFSKSPMTDINNYVHDISVVAQSIVHIIMRS